MLPGMTRPRQEQIREFERLGESEVRYLLKETTFSSLDNGSLDRRVAEEWLRQREDSRAAESSARRDAREEETLSIARKASEDARSARRTAIIAAIIAAIASMISAYISASIKK